MRHRAAIALLIFVGCGNGSKTPVPNTLFADATLRPRAEAAPELLREAEEALSRAGHESDPEASADHLTEARLLFLAAVAEGERRLLL
ncbi:MAG: hypothetical protein H5U40_01290, partial [Polyangiaceae bacterium]|nr:hypothetical protein [Polyangiaceae bacterium]